MILTGKMVSLKEIISLESFVGSLGNRNNNAKAIAIIQRRILNAKLS
jgi:hypothetical protein